MLKSHCSFEPPKDPDDKQETEGEEEGIVPNQTSDSSDNDGGGAANTNESTNANENTGNETTNENTSPAVTTANTPASQSAKKCGGKGRNGTAITATESEFKKQKLDIRLGAMVKSAAAEGGITVSGQVTRGYFVKIEGFQRRTLH